MDRRHAYIPQQMITMCQQKLFCLKSRHAVCKCLHFLLTNTRNIIRFEYEHIFQSSCFEMNRDEKKCCAQCKKQRYEQKKKGDLTVLQVPKLGQLQEKQCHLAYRTQGVHWATSYNLAVFEVHILCPSEPEGAQAGLWCTR